MKAKELIERLQATDMDARVFVKVGQGLHQLEEVTVYDGSAGDEPEEAIYILYFAAPPPDPTPDEQPAERMSK